MASAHDDADGAVRRRDGRFRRVGHPRVRSMRVSSTSPEGIGLVGEEGRNPAPLTGS